MDISNDDPNVDAAALAAAAPAIATSPGARATSTRPMWILGLVIMVDQLDQSVVRGAGKSIQDAFSVSDSQLGLLLSAFVIVNGLITVPAGYLADRWNRTRTIGHTVVLWSAITMVTAAAQNFATLVGLRGLLGFGQGITEPSAASLLSDYYPTTQRGKVFSNQQIMGFIGLGLGTIIGGVVASQFNWRVAFLVAAMPGFIIAGLAYSLREPARGAADRLHLGLEEPAEAEAVPLFDRGFRGFVRDLVVGLRQDFAVIWSITTLRFALAGVGALMFTVSAIGAWLPRFHERYSGLSEAKSSSVVGLLLIAGGIPGLILGGRFADRFADRVQGARVVIPAYCIGIGITLFTFSYIKQPAGSSIALQLFGIFWITMALPALRAGLADAVPSHLRGAGFGAFNLAAVVFGAAAAPWVVGTLSSAYDLRTAFFIVSPPVYVGAFLLFRARKHLDTDAMKIFEAVMRAVEQEQAREAELQAASEASSLPNDHEIDR